ncbi:hypothetical protein BAV0592 [Bordetella avium 197N]|uniref:Uncharacterized protein n=1 Tax=Bordetella avium (strain 197N) TaxID=360910 RepID=Q2KXW7_BORA1|nr:hypothetical protein BAV0592 [Bordetella avium 197N]
MLRSRLPPHHVGIDIAGVRRITRCRRDQTGHHNPHKHCLLKPGMALIELLG